MSELLPSPELVFDDQGSPRSQRFGDVYGTKAGRLEQARQVFLAGCNLPCDWARQNVYTILELGFGLGTNFLATLAAWRADPDRCESLDYIAVEGFPLTRAQLQGMGFEGDTTLHTELCARWPEQPRQGFLRLGFGLDANDAKHRVRLILVLMDVSLALTQINASVDACFLDGFAPRKNPEMFSLATLMQLHRLLRVGARVSSYSVAGELRANLQALGFSVAREKGFGGKKQRLVARRGIDSSRQLAKNGEVPRHVAVIGAGIAGLALAHALSRLGCKVTVFESAVGLGSGASGVPACLLHPPSGSQLSAEFQLQDAAFELALAELEALRAGGQSAGFQAMPIHERRKNHREANHERGGMLVPELLLAALKAQVESGSGSVMFGKTLRSVQNAAANVELHFADGSLCLADAVVVASAFANIRIDGNAMDRTLPRLQPVAGQVEVLSGSVPQLQKAFCGMCNIVPISTQQVLLGNSFHPDQIAETASLTMRAELAHAASQVTGLDFAALQHCTWQSWVGTRAQSPDRKPLVGKLQSNIYLNLAHGSKGFCTAFLAAEVLSAMIFGRTPAASASTLAIVDCGRFVR